MHTHARARARTHARTRAHTLPLLWRHHHDVHGPLPSFAVQSAQPTARCCCAAAAHRRPRPGGRTMWGRAGPSAATSARASRHRGWVGHPARTREQVAAASETQRSDQNPTKGKGAHPRFHPDSAHTQAAPPDRRRTGNARRRRGARAPFGLGDPAPSRPVPSRPVPARPGLPAESAAGCAGCRGVPLRVPLPTC
jgi:hypothetical protein